MRRMMEVQETKIPKVLVKYATTGKATMNWTMVDCERATSRGNTLCRNDATVILSFDCVSFACRAPPSAMFGGQESLCGSAGCACVCARCEVCGDRGLMCGVWCGVTMRKPKGEQEKKEESPQLFRHPRRSSTDDKSSTRRWHRQRSGGQGQKTRRRS